MRVITSFGFGKTIDPKINWTNEERIPIDLEKPHLGVTKMTLGKEEAFPFSDWAVMKVLNIAGHHWFSNLQFQESQATAESILTLPSPPDETTFFLNLQTGEFRVNRQLGVFARYSLILRPWIDRWAEEKTDAFKLIGNARKALKEEKESLTGTSGGILALIHLDEKLGGMLSFCLIIPPPNGVIFEKEFEARFPKK